MPGSIDRQDVQRLLVEDRAQLVECLEVPLPRRTDSLRLQNDFSREIELDHVAGGWGEAPPFRH
jgi:hypothetical protein